VIAHFQSFLAPRHEQATTAAIRGLTDATDRREEDELERHDELRAALARISTENLLLLWVTKPLRVTSLRVELQAMETNTCSDTSCLYDPHLFMLVAQANGRQRTYSA